MAFWIISAAIAGACIGVVFLALVSVGKNGKEK